ncbi:hypothetical protein N7481_002887 [Penicillium waksmanii]|uniref:uncharacterized protein n=1 Tax=Penicillium waksmanii TaxID=69791 RepID=UPI0025489A98|nr:uncharacterized protein N7481_002887 [Penicillium waksmanii]KAJ5995910.1 hypothetical protein N7481_002887 [Penicillium waksmanii]
MSLDIRKDSLGTDVQPDEKKGKHLPHSPQSESIISGVQLHGRVIVTIGQGFLMASLAEMCSIWPYAGGQQVFTQRLAPPSVRRFLSYAIGWVIFLGEIATAASCTMNSAQVCIGIIQISYPDWEATRWLEWLMYVGLTILALTASLSQKHLPLLSLVGGFIVIVGAIVWAALFLALGPKQSASFVFTQFLNNSGYESRGWVGIMSFYTPMYALYGTDGILHIAEEMKDPERNAPMLWRIAYNFSIPYVTWFVDVLQNPAGGIAFVVIILIVINLFICMGLNTAASRLTWGMARDNALPFSNIFVQINHTLDTPLNTLILSGVAQLIIGVVVFGSDYAFQVIISIGLVAIQVGYLIPTFLIVVTGRKALPTPRAFNLGAAGWAINIFSVCWCLLISVMLL